MGDRLGNYIRSLRTQAGLTQRQLARIVGYDDDKGPISAHERLRSLPPLLVAIAYSLVFQKSMPEIFPGLFDVVEHAVEAQLSQLEEELDRSNTTSITAKALEWLALRRQHPPNNRAP